MSKHVFHVVFAAAALVVAAGCTGGGNTAGIAPGPTPTAKPSSTASASSSASPSASPTSSGSATASPTATATATPTGSATATPTGSATATPTASASPVSASGTVVDFDTNAGLSGITISIAPLGSGSPYTPVTTSGAGGAFTFTAAPGTYVLAVGSNSSSDQTRATEHDVVTLYPNTANALTAVIPSPAPQVTLAPSQLSGNFRLAALNSTEQSCFQGVNAGRSSKSLSALIYDEYSLEYSRASIAEEVAQKTDAGNPLVTNPGTAFLTPLGFQVVTSGQGFANCTAYTNSYTFNSTSVPYPVAIQPSIAWYAASFASGSTNYTNEIFDIDPSAASSSNAIRRAGAFHPLR